MAYLWIKPNILYPGLQDLIDLGNTDRDLWHQQPMQEPTRYFTFSTNSVYIYLHDVWRASVTLCTCIQDAICFYFYLVKTVSNPFFYFTVCRASTEELHSNVMLTGSERVKDFTEIHWLMCVIFSLDKNNLMLYIFPKWSNDKKLCPLCSHCKASGVTTHSNLGLNLLNDQFMCVLSRTEIVTTHRDNHNVLESCVFRIRYFSYYSNQILIMFNNFNKTTVDRGVVYF